MRERLKDPARRLVALIGVIVVLLGVALGVSVWRFGSAIDSDHLALRESQEQVAKEQMRTALARKAGLVDARGGSAARLRRDTAAGLERLPRRASEEGWQSG